MAASETSSGGGEAQDGGVTEPTPTLPEFSRIHWVATSGSDAAAGTESAPFRTVAKAISVLQPGEAVYLKAGTYSERLLLNGKDGAAGKHLTLRGAPGATAVLKGGTGSGASLIEIRRAYWAIENLTLDVAGDPAFAILWRGAGAHHGILRGCTVKNGKAGAGVNVAESASDILIEGNEISNFVKTDDDSHGVIIQTTTRNVIVRGNDIHHNSGDAVQCIGPEGGATISGTPADNVVVEGNLLHENRENGADIKTCSRVVIRRNTIYGHRRSSSSRGEGVVVHLSARDITLEENVLRSNGRGISIGGVREGDPPTNVVIRRNVIHDGYNGDGEEGTGIRIDTAVNIQLHHNTVWNMPGNCLGFGSGDSGDTKGLDARNNIFARCGYALRAGPSRSSVVSDANLFFQPTGGATFSLEGVVHSLAGWRTATGGLDLGSMETSPGFLNIDTGDFRLGPTSKARNAGVPLGMPFCGAAPDLGALEADCP